MARQLDTIYLRNLHISAIIGPDAWGRKDKLQPVVLNIRLKVDTTNASTSDDINDTFSYGQVCKEITSQLDGKAFDNLQHLITVLTTFAAFWPGEDTKLQALAPKALLRVEGGLELSHSIRKKDRYEENGVPQVRHVDTRSWSIKGLKLACIIGVNKHERLEKQSVNVDLRIPAINPKTFDAKEGSNENWRTLVKRVCEVSLLLALRRRLGSNPTPRSSNILPLKRWKHWQHASPRPRWIAFQWTRSLCRWRNQVLSLSLRAQASRSPGASHLMEMLPLP